MINGLYENIGEKIKNLAKWIFIVEAVGIIITGLILIFNDVVLYGLLTLFCGPISAWVSSWILYAFGELVEDVHAIRNKEGTTVEKAKREAEIKARCEVERRTAHEAWENAKFTAKEIAEKKMTEATVLENLRKSFESSPPIQKPSGFYSNNSWANEIEKLSAGEIYIRYLDKDEWSESYRYICYLELKKRLKIK